MTKKLSTTNSKKNAFSKSINKTSSKLLKTQKKWVRYIEDNRYLYWVIQFLGSFFYLFISLVPTLGNGGEINGFLSWIAYYNITFMLWLWLWKLIPWVLYKRFHIATSPLSVAMAWSVKEVSGFHTFLVLIVQFLGTLFASLIIAFWIQGARGVAEPTYVDGVLVSIGDTFGGTAPAMRGWVLNGSSNGYIFEGQDWYLTVQIFVNIGGLMLIAIPSVLNEYKHYSRRRQFILQAIFQFIVYLLFYKFNSFHSNTFRYLTGGIAVSIFGGYVDWGWTIALMGFNFLTITTFALVRRGLRNNKNKKLEMTLKQQRDSIINK